MCPSYDLVFMFIYFHHTFTEFSDKKEVLVQWWQFARVFRMLFEHWYSLGLRFQNMVFSYFHTNFELCPMKPRWKTIRKDDWNENRSDELHVARDQFYCQRPKLIDIRSHDFLFNLPQMERFPGWVARLAREQVTIYSFHFQIYELTQRNSSRQDSIDWNEVFDVTL